MFQLQLGELLMQQAEVLFDQKTSVGDVTQEAAMSLEAAVETYVNNFNDILNSL